MVKKIVAVKSRGSVTPAKKAKADKFARKFAKNHRALLHSLSQK